MLCIVIRNIYVEFGQNRHIILTNRAKKTYFPYMALIARAGMAFKFPFLILYASIGTTIRLLILDNRSMEIRKSFCYQVETFYFEHNNDINLAILGRRDSAVG